MHFAMFVGRSSDFCFISNHCQSNHYVRGLELAGSRICSFIILQIYKKLIIR